MDTPFLSINAGIRAEWIDYIRNLVQAKWNLIHGLVCCSEVGPPMKKVRCVLVISSLKKFLERPHRSFLPRFVLMRECSKPLANDSTLSMEEYLLKR